MAPRAIINLTGNDESVHPTRKFQFLAPTREVRTVQSINTSVSTNRLPTLQNSKKRKRDEATVPIFRSSRQKAESIVLDDSDPETPPSRRKASSTSSHSVAISSPASSQSDNLSRRIGSLSICPELVEQPSFSYRRQHFQYGNRNPATFSHDISHNFILIADGSGDALSFGQHEYHTVDSQQLSDGLDSSQILGNRPVEIDDDDNDDSDIEIIGATGYERPTSTTDEDYAMDSEMPRILRNLSIAYEREQREQLNQLTERSSFRGNGISCAPGKSVQLRDKAFMHILSVLENRNGDVFISGRRLVRVEAQGPKMPQRRNELVWVQPENKKSTSKPEDTTIYSVPVTEVLKNREIIFTNRRYPTVSLENDDSSFADPTRDEEFGPLFVRWKASTVYDTKGRPEEIIEHLLSSDADDGLRTSKSGEVYKTRYSDRGSRFEWRKSATVRGGSYCGKMRAFDLDGRQTTTATQKYTIGDAFCGAGGTSRGAVDAGLFVKWGFDNDPWAMAVYATNFKSGGTECREQSVNDFLTQPHEVPPSVDILHISPPCQPFAWPNTNPNPEKNEINQAAMTSVFHLVQRIKPRVVTLEQTDGLASLRAHRAWFNGLIEDLLRLGYSVRWAILRFDEFGVPQTRKRLVFIASGPGEKLPEFPDCTHGEAADLKPFVFIDDRIRDIHLNAAEHDTSVQFRGPTQDPFDPKTPAKTICANGGMGNRHPSGLRPYTIRELACLQTFPLIHKFAAAGGRTRARKQIGNAVPPAFAKTLFKSITKSLREADRDE